MWTSWQMLWNWKTYRINNEVIKETMGTQHISDYSEEKLYNICGADMCDKNYE